MRAAVLVLVLAALLAGCAGPAGDAPTPERWRADPPWPADEWPDDLAASPEVRVEAPAEVAAGDAFGARVTNGLARGLAHGGTDCGFHLARPAPDAWVVFAPFPGNYLESLVRVEPGRACDADLDLASLEDAPLAPGPYRLVHVARENGPDGPLRLGGAPLTIR